MTVTITNEHLRKELNRFERTEDIKNLLEELRHSELLMPVNDEGGCPLLQINGNDYIPLFTDIHEYGKVSECRSFRPVSFGFNFYLNLLREESPEFILNVESERFPITREFLDIMDENHVFDVERQVFTRNEIRKIKDSIDNSRLNGFLKNPDNHYKTDELLELLLVSDVFTVVYSKSDLKKHEVEGVIELFESLPLFKTNDNYALIFTDEDKINVNVSYTYSQLVNVPEFIDDALKADLSGIIINYGEENIILSRDVLIEFLRDFKCPNLAKFDSYAFPIEGKI